MMLFDEELMGLIKRRDELVANFGLVKEACRQDGNTPERMLALALLDIEANQINADLKAYRKKSKEKIIRELEELKKLMESMDDED